MNTEQMHKKIQDAIDNAAITATDMRDAADGHIDVEDVNMAYLEAAVRLLRSVCAEMSA